MNEKVLDFLSVFIFINSCLLLMAAWPGAQRLQAEVKWFFGQWNGMVRRLPCFIATALNTNFRDWLHLQATQATQDLGMPLTEFLPV